MSPKISHERTTIGLTRSTYNRLAKAKPYETASFDEFVSELVDVYEEDQTS